MKILVVDDEEVIRRLFQQMLSQHQVVTAASGEEAVEKIRAGEKFDAAFIDIRLPGMNGVEVLVKLKESSRKTRAIMMTGFAEDQLIQRALTQAGAGEVIKKPFDLTIIQNLLEQVFLEGDGRSPKVLVVDDEPAIRELFRQAQSANAHQVSCVEDGEKALEALARGRFDLAFIDLNLPGIGGMEIFRAIQEQYPGTAVVLFSGYSEHKDDLERAKEMGALAGLKKPFDLKEILEIIHEVARGRKDSCYT